MSQYQVSATAVIDAPPAHVYAIIADYHQGHQAILPTRYFTEMAVTAGGQGAGTRLTLHMDVLGTKILYHMEVTEPEPGRLLVEQDKEAGVTTSFTLDPLRDGQQTRVTIATTARTSPGLKGLVERVLSPAIIRRIYREELVLLARVAAEGATG